MSSENFGRPYLVHRYWDGWLVGGLSLVAVFLFRLLWDPKGGPKAEVASVVFYLSFVMNFPHFLLSYHLMYWDRSAEVLRRRAYVWAGVAVPGLLLGAIALGFFWRGDLIFSGLLHLMLLSVGWHYVKQTFGVMIVLSARRKFYFSRDERLAILGSLICLWCSAYIGANLQNPTQKLWGLQIYGLKFSKLNLRMAFGFLALVTLAAVGLQVFRYIRTKRRMPVAAMVAYLSVFAWFILATPLLALVIPFFHSLQYLVFVSSVKSRQWSEQGRRAEVFRWAALYLGSAVLFGGFFFQWVPNALDRHAIGGVALTPTLFLLLFNIFLNIHHYFLDAVLWRKDNEWMSRYLFS